MIREPSLITTHSTQPARTGAPISACATEVLLRCPICHGSLAAPGIELGCSRCRRAWHIERGVPHFGGHDRRPHALKYAQRALIAGYAVNLGWEAALHDGLRALDEATYRQAIDEYRAQWRFVLPLTPSSRVLDLSCGWGAVAFNLAENCALVAAADGCDAQARFVALRAQQLQRDNMIALQLGLDQPLPFAPHSFDAVILIDGLAWAGDAAVQRALLSRIHAVLHPEGRLFLAESNALGPHRMAKRYASARLHTVRGYQRLLRTAGFHSMQVYALAPSQLEPFFVVPLDQHAPLAYFVRQIVGAQNFEAHFRQRGMAALYRAVRVGTNYVPAAMLARFARLFVPGVAIVAQG